MLMTSWPRPHLEVPQNSEWPLWKENRILIKWSVILMATYKTGDLLRSIKFVCMSEGKAFKNYLLLGFFPAVPCNIILPNICELWLKSAVLFLAENKREAGEQKKKKSGANLSAQALIIGYRIFSPPFQGRRIWWECFSLQGEISDIHPETNHKAKLSCKTAQGKKWSLWVKFSSKFAADP